MKTGTINTNEGGGDGGGNDGVPRLHQEDSRGTRRGGWGDRWIFVGRKTFRILFQEIEHHPPPTMQCPVGQEGGCQGTACEVIVIKFSQRLFIFDPLICLRIGPRVYIASEVAAVSQDNDYLWMWPSSTSNDKIWYWEIFIWGTHFSISLKVIRTFVMSLVSSRFSSRRTPNLQNW